MSDERTSAEQAAMHVMTRIIRDPRITYFFGPGSETWTLVTAAVAEMRGETPEAYRAHIAPGLSVERPTGPDLLAALESELADLDEDIRWAQASDLDRLIPRRERMEAAIAKARGQ